MRGSDPETIGSEKIDRLLISGFGGAKAISEFIWREILMINRAGRIVEIIKETLEPGGIADRKADGQPELFIGSEPSDGLRTNRS